ncbi:MAG: tetratricopeptide repeat protein [Pseudomonadota bacterium]
MLQKIENLLNNNRLTEARKLCEQHSHNNKKSFETWMLLANIYQRSEAFDKAEKAYRKAIKLNPSSSAAQTNLAMLYHGQGKFSKAEAPYLLSLKLDTQQASVHYNLANVQQTLNKQNDAIIHYQKAVSLQPDYVRALANLGFLLRQQGLANEAIDSYQKALLLAPNMIEIHYNLGLSLLDIGDTHQSEIHQRQAIALNPEYADAWSGLGAIDFFKGNMKNAEAHYQRALSYQPDNIEILCGLSNVLLEQSEHEQAMQFTTKAISIEPDNLLAHITQGSIYSSNGDFDQALSSCDKILKLQKNNEDAACLAASIYERKGDENHAYNYLKPLLKQKHPSIRAVIIFSSLSKSLNLSEKAIQKIENILDNSVAISKIQRRKLFFTLGKKYDEIKNYDKAFAAYKNGNVLNKSNFCIRSMKNDVDLQIETFSTNFHERLNSSKNNSKRPIFIVGMPRSGTSLLEQILSSHPKISAAGELPDINILATSISNQNNKNDYYATALKQIKRKHLNSLAQSYLDKIASVDSDALHITDKMPSNFMHLGFIQLLFPDAIIIHCKRNPIDTCLSCYFQDFSQPHPWIYDLNDVANVYLEYLRLIKHWKSILTIPILDIQYEELVDNQESISRKIIEFCGVDWNDSCLQFHENTRFAKTASYDQVRQPMYKKSVARWKNYESHIKPLIDILKNIP